MIFLGNPEIIRQRVAAWKLAIISALVTLNLGITNLQTASAEARILKSEKQGSEHIAEIKLSTAVNVPAGQVWDTLVNFDLYPKIFAKIESVTVNRRDGDLVYIETVLKKQMFVKHFVQHTVNDLSGGPVILRWQLTDGNFKHIDGEWEITASIGDTCTINYCLKVDPGPLIPTQLATPILHVMANEIVGDLKRFVEKTYAASLASSKRKASSEVSQKID